MAILDAKLKAGTLLEALMAMAIVVFCIGAGLTIYLNVFKAFNHHKSIKANLILNDIALDIKSKNRTEATFIELEQFNISVSMQVSKYENIKTLILTLEEKNGNVIKTRKELIYVEEEGI